MASNNTKNQPNVEDPNIQNQPEVEQKDTQEPPKTEDQPKPEKKTAPQTVRVRVLAQSSFYHPYTGKMITSEFKDFIFDGWLAAQLAANLVEVQDLQGHNLVMVDGKLVKG